jgi:hypothetical protein
MCKTDRDLSHPVFADCMKIMPQGATVML